MRALLLMVLSLLWPAAVSAQAVGCAVPATVPAPRLERPSPRAPARVLPIGGYSLALSWSPQFCRGRAGAGDQAFQCGTRGRFGFVLHGLWPDGEGRQWPQYCRPAGLVPEAVIRRNLCAMPSAQLQQHEWAKHGSCMANDPARYLDRARELFERVRFPDMDALSRRRLTRAGFATAFARANPGLPRGAVLVEADRQGWLTGVRLCHDKALKPARCRFEADEGGRALRIWRGGGGRRAYSPPAPARPA
jgi:ribonuclease T2